MNFYALFMIVIVGLGGYFYVYPAYQLKQEEDKIRQNMKQIPNQSRTQNLENIYGYTAQAEMLNQYPNFIVYIRFDELNDQTAPESVQAIIREFSCDGLNRLKNNSELVRKATLNVIKEDQHQFQYILKNNLGYEIFKYQQVMENCPNIAELYAYQNTEEIKN
ncbi:hypothetical protein ABD624_13460 [Avibacterium paragallinarum]